MKHFFFICCLIIMASCAKSNQNEKTIYIEHSNFVEEPLSIYFKVENATCLDKRNRSIIGVIDKLITYNNKYFILDRFVSGDIYVFDKKTGNFLYNIGRQWDGPGGYSLPYDFLLLPDKEQIEVLVPGQILVYNLSNGEYIQSKELGLPATRFHKTNKGYAFVLGSKQNQLALTNNDLDTLSTFFPFTRMHSMLPDNSFVKIEDGFLFHRNFENTIYRIHDNDIEEHVFFDFGQGIISMDEKKTIKDIDQIYSKFSNKKLNFKFYLETENHYIFPYIYKSLPFLFIKNKKTGNEKIFDISNVENDLGYGTSFPMPIGTNKKGNLLCYINLEAVKNNMQLEKSGCHNSIDYLILELKINI